MPPALKGKERSDEALMLRAQADDTEAFAELYDRHAERALRLARAICGDASRAEDAVREGFLVLWRGRAGYRPGAGGFRAWSMRIVMNRAMVAQGEREELIDSLRRLPGAQAEVIVLAFYGELSHSEIAKQLELPAGTVKGRMRLGLEKLRCEMD